MEYNIETEEVNVIQTLDFELGENLSYQPNIFEMNSKQNCSIVSNIHESAFFNHETGHGIYIGEMFNISLIREIVYDNDTNQFFILANKYRGKLGLYVIKFHE